VNVRTRLSALACFVAVVTLAGQEGQPRDPQAADPVFRSSANAIRVDMYATKSGEPVTDLRPDEVEVTEDNVKQKIDTFEYVHLTPETATVSGQNPNARARVFIIFVDTYSTRFTGQADLRKSLLRLLDRLLLPNDLVGLMTSDMAAPDVTLGRRATVISDLANDARWSQRTPADRADPKEYAWENCYGNMDPRLGDMKRRRRAKVTLQALQDLSAYLGGLREERKAVLLVSGGWYFPEQTPEAIAGESERIRRGETSTCEADWRALQRVDYERMVNQLGRSANRANVSFYPVNLRSNVPNRGRGGRTFNRTRTGNEEQLHRLAETTDGLAEIGAPDLEEVTDRIIRDTSSYYLLSYQPGNWKSDSSYHAITVRVKRPGVSVRARAGYGGEVVHIVKLDPTPVRPAIDGHITAAFETVRRFESLTPVWLRTSAYAAPAGSGDGGAFWLIGQAGGGAPQTFKDRTVEVLVTGSDKRQVLAQTITLPAADMFTVRVPETGTLPLGSYGVRIRIRPPDDAGAVMVQDLPRVELAADAAGLGEPVLWRRGPLVRDVYQQTADPRFHRNERLRVEFATGLTESPVGQLLDRAGHPLQVQVPLTERSADGVRWIGADLPLTSFAPGDYAISVSQGNRTQLTAFRIVP
jgi:VWFA-related protein